MCIAVHLNFKALTYFAAVQAKYYVLRCQWCDVKTAIPIHNSFISPLWVYARTQSTESCQLDKRKNLYGVAGVVLQLEALVHRPCEPRSNVCGVATVCGVGTPGIGMAANSSAPVVDSVMTGDNMRKSCAASGYWS
jgi:hypothetical protein